MLRVRNNASIVVLHLLSIIPRGRHLPLRIVNARKKIVLEDEQYDPFRFLLIPQEERGMVANFEFEFPRNRRTIQGVLLGELNEAEVTVRTVREDHPTQVFQTYSGIFQIYGGKIWINHLRKGWNPKTNGMLRILQWTAEAPTRPGWYWLRERQISASEGEAKIVEVVKGRFGLEVKHSNLSKPLKTISGEWGGPIQEPEEKKDL